MKGSEQVGPAGLWAAGGFPVQSGWASHLGTQPLEGESAPLPGASCKKVAEQLAGL